jgi:hypothetical protein
MATISFFAGFEIKDREKTLKILEVLKEPGQPVLFTPEEEELFRKQEEAGRESIDKLGELLEKL